MAFTPYVSTPEFKEWVVLNDTVDDATITEVVTAVTRWIDLYTQRHFWRDGTTGSEVARQFASNCGYDLAIDDLVPGTITALKTDATGDGTFETTWTAADYQLLPVNRPAGEPYTSVEAVGGQMFPSRTTRMSRANRVEITGIWGWTAVPDPVQQACLIQASRILKRRHSPEGVAGFGDFGAIRITSRLDPDVQQLLDPYRHPRTVVMVA